MARYIIVSVVAGILFGILDAVINANPLAQRLYAVYKPIARTSINPIAGVVIDLVCRSAHPQSPDEATASRGQVRSGRWSRITGQSTRHIAGVPFFTARFSSLVRESTFWKVFLTNLVVSFLGVQVMNLFRVGRRAGGLYALPIFWLIYGLLLGTNSCVFAGIPVPSSLKVLWTRTGFSELLAYTLGL